MTPEELSRLVADELASVAVDDTLAIESELSVTKVKCPRFRKHDGQAANVAMQLARRAGRNSHKLDRFLAARTTAHDEVEGAEVAGPGFVNIRLSAASIDELAWAVVGAGGSYRCMEGDADKTVNLGYVSVNPTDPLHIGGTCWVAVSDSLTRILEFSGARVTKECYFNDHSSQIDRFATSLLIRACDKDVPEDGYSGQYVTEVTERVVTDSTADGELDPRELSDGQAHEAFRSRGVGLMFVEIKSSPRGFRPGFDAFFHEDPPHESGTVSKTIERLHEHGVVYEEEGALWFYTMDFGGDKDRVIVKSDGEATYFVGSLAYYPDKRARGADNYVYILDAGHRGHIGHMYAMARACDGTVGPGENVKILIGQLVDLVRSGVPVYVSKRARAVMTLKNFVDAAGVDAVRYSLVRASVGTTFDLDSSLVTSHMSDNPVYYAQYVYARTCLVTSNTVSRGIRHEDGFAPGLLDAVDSELLGMLARFPDITVQSTILCEPHRVARCLEEVTAAYHIWYGRARITLCTEEEVADLHRTRLWVSDAAGVVLTNGPSLLSISAHLLHTSPSPRDS